MSDQPSTFYITTPIYYANGRPHLGHAYTTILCDVVTRVHGIFGQKTYFLTGTDEHGDKIFKEAQKQGKTAQELADENAPYFKSLLPIIEAQTNDFIRTTEKRHIQVVQSLLAKVYEKGDIYFGEYGGKYCYGCERYYADDELVEGKCPDHKTVPDYIAEKNYFFKMSKYWQQLKDHVESNPDFIVPESYRKEVLGLLKNDPQDLCISRPKERLTWGIELPFDTNYVTYVWFDALINYVSALGGPQAELFKQFWPQSHHAIAKDILKPHCIYWPTMLMSMELSLPKQIPVHGYWLVDESKMSKSIGTVVDPLKYCETYTADVFRYFLMRAMRFGKDSTFSHEDFLAIYNADLANKVGNLYSRIVGLCRKYCENKIPGSTVVTKTLDTKRAELYEKIKLAIKTWAIHDYPGSIINYAEDINKFLDEYKPWTKIKDPDSFEQASSILKEALEGVRVIYSWLWPMMPEKSALVLKELGLPADQEFLANSISTWDLLSVGNELATAPSGFPRIQE